MKAGEKAIFRICEISSFVYSRFVEVEESEPIRMDEVQIQISSSNGLLFLSVIHCHFLSLYWVLLGLKAVKLNNYEYLLEAVDLFVNFRLKLEVKNR
jgi:hypothetical protein